MECIETGPMFMYITTTQHTRLPMQVPDRFRDTPSSRLIPVYTQGHPNFMPVEDVLHRLSAQLSNTPLFDSTTHSLGPHMRHFITAEIQCLMTLGPASCGKLYCELLRFVMSEQFQPRWGRTHV